MNTNQRIASLERNIIQAIEERDQVLKRNAELEEENKELRNKLAYYENPNTPPSVELRKGKLKRKKKTRKKRGAPKGHRGATRKQPEPEETINVRADKCPHCNSDPGTPTDVKEVVIEEIISPPKIKIIKFIRHKYMCQHCNIEFTATHEDCPQKGNFGPSLLSYVTMLKYHLRGPYRKVQDFLFNTNDFTISTKGLMDMILRVGDTCKHEYDGILARVRSAKWVHIDETGIHINGEKWWLWIFRTDSDDILVVIRKSRGRKVIDEVLGKNPEMPVIVDGWRSYSHIKTTQRCWAHLLRVIDEYKEGYKNGMRLSKEIHSLFDEMRQFLDKGPSMTKRVIQKQEFDKKMEHLVKRFSKFEELDKEITYIKGGHENWFTCLLYPGMEPTNNLAEQAIREHVIIRNLIGCFRSENGSQNYQYISSLLATWRLQGKNMFVELESLLRRDLCLA